MDKAEWHRRWMRFWRPENPRMSVVRDVVVMAAVLILVLGSLWVYTGQPFPNQAPLVVVESGSMMHGSNSPCLEGRACAPYGTPSFGRAGTIDPGDLVFVKRVHKREDVVTAFDSRGRSGYGGHGDVIVYKSVPRNLLIIHRAMLYIEITPEGCRPADVAQPCTYRIPETCAGESFGRFVKEGEWAKYCEGSRDPISLKLERDGLFVSLMSYPCTQPCGTMASGFITKGDNNLPADNGPGGNTCCPVSLDRIVGKARAEIPWFGLIKLALAGNPRYGPHDDPSGATQWVVLNARAPWDEWVAFFLVVGFLAAAPPAYEFVRKRWWKRKDGSE